MTEQVSFAGLASTGSSAGTYAAVESAQTAVQTGTYQANKEGIEKPFVLELHIRRPALPIFRYKENVILETPQLEIIALCSGKGGTGKTLMASCLGYALTRSGHNVLMVDADPATDGLSLFLLGPKGIQQIDSFTPGNTFSGLLRQYERSQTMDIEVRNIHRSGVDDHGISYKSLISGRGLYGDVKGSGNELAVPDLDRDTFRDGVKHLFGQLRAKREFDYVIVDTRGGFAFESTDVCALADSFILVTDPDITSFYQTRNLIQRISKSADELQSRALLRAILVNKATDIRPEDTSSALDNIEVSFRMELTKEFPVKFSDTHAVPADFEALLAYKAQRIPYLACPSSMFSFATLSAFSDILKVVTSRWTDEQISRWNELVHLIAKAVNERVQRDKEKAAQEEALSAEIVSMRGALEQSTRDALTAKKEVSRLEALLERESKRTDLLAQGARHSPEAWPAPGGLSSATRDDLPEAHPRQSTGKKFLWAMAVGLLCLCLGIAVFLLTRSHQSVKPSSVAGPPSGSSQYDRSEPDLVDSAPKTSSKLPDIGSVILPTAFESQYVVFETQKVHQWKLLKPGYWIEYYGGQLENVYDEVAEQSVGGCPGAVLQKRREPTTSIFIPSLDCDLNLQYKADGENWKKLGPIKDPVIANTGRESARPY